MILSCETKDLAAAMAVAGRVVPQKAHIPILQCVRLTTNDNRVTVTGTSMDTSFQMDVAATVTTEGEACLPFATLRDFIAKAKGTTVSIEVDGASAAVKSGRGRIGLMTQHAEDFPDIAPINGEPVTIGAPAFCHALRFCTAAAATDDTKWHLKGAWFSESDGGVIAYGTDGFHVHRAALDGVAAIGGGGIVPTEAAQTILSIADKEDTVRALISERGWLASCGSVCAWGKCIDGQFPNVSAMLAGFTGWSEIASVEHDDMASGLDVASCGADIDSDKSRATVLRFDDDTIVLRGLKASAGVSKAGRSEVVASVSAPMAGAFNSKHLRDAMTGLKVPRIAIWGAVSGDRQIIQVRPAQSDAAVSMEATIMAMRVPNEDLADV